jgi:Tol biopolymer transport system component
MTDALIVTDVLHSYAGRLAWEPGGNGLTFDKIDEEDANRYFDLWSMTPNGNLRQCLTRDKPAPFTHRHIGQPAWHPDGAWIVYQAEKDDAPLFWDPYATPGSGMQNDLYVMPPDASTTTRVYASVAGSGGVLHPHFSGEGSKLSWSEYVGGGRSPLGHWVLKQAAFIVEHGRPTLANVQTADPGAAPDWIENHGYDPVDDRFILCSGNPNGEPVLRSNVYVYDSLALTLEQLTDNACWEEHAHASPNGEWVVFMRGLEDDTPLEELETELWIMSRDGSRQQQLTYFHTPGHPHFVAERGIVCADSDWHPDGRQLAVFTQDRLSNQGQIRICRLDLDRL